MPELPSPVDELTRRERYFRIGCWLNGSIALMLLFGVTFLAWWVAQLEQGRAYAAAKAPDGDEKAVREVLDGQVAAWNKADIDGFMKGYWKDEKLSFISGGSITRGWEQTRERYVKKYQAEGKDKMGTLSFDELHVETFGADAAMVTGRFKLVRGEQTDVGRFTLAFRKLPDGWRIVHDHTSVDCPKEKK